MRCGRGRRTFGLGLGVAMAIGACGGPAARRAGHPLPPGLYATAPSLVGANVAVLRGRRILIDPGHGGRFEGTEGVEHTREGDVNLGVALHLWGLLHDAGADVFLTRASDRDLLGPGGGALRDDLKARVALLDSLRPDVFLSLHHNSNAALDRERNGIETYYKLEDDGPSYDLGRAIHGQLVRALGIDNAHLAPGNYFVLRGARTAAVLGEASYLSNPAVESRLQLAASQKLEAEAYFLGIIDYFARGIATVEKTSPAGDTLDVGGVMRFRVAAGLEPATAEVRVDGRPLAVRAFAGEFIAAGDLAAGVHTVAATARLVGGNAARAWRGELVVYAPPVRAVLDAAPPSLEPGGAAHIEARIQDRSGRAVADGVHVTWDATGATLLDADSVTAGGVAIAVVRATTAAPRVRVRSGSVIAELALAVAAGTNGVEWRRIVDARRGVPVADAWSDLGTHSDRRGWIALSNRVTDVRRQGYVPWRGTAARDSALRLEPLAGGVWLDLPLVLDPAGNGGEATRTDLGFAPADVASEITQSVQTMLAASGARAVSTRGAADAVTDLDRVRLAARTGARWFVRIEVVSAGPGAVLYYPGSADGERLANALGRALGRRQLGPALVRTDTRWVLQQTPCPAVAVQLLATAVRSAAERREAAVAIVQGLRNTLDPAAELLPPLAGHVDAAGSGLVTLDDAETVPLTVRGTFRFDAVRAGFHRLSLLDGATPDTLVQVNGQDTTYVEIAPRH